MALYIGTSEVTKIQIGTTEVLRIEDANGNLLYNAAPPATVSVTLRYTYGDFSWTSDYGSSGTMTSGDPDYTLTVEDGETVTFTTSGGKLRLSVNGVDQCSGPNYDYNYPFGYADLAEGDVISCESFFEPC